MNEQRFAATARRLSGQAALLLNWRIDEFWDATPDELAAVLSAMSGETGAGGALLSRAEVERMMENEDG